MKLAGKTVAITGASRGLGKEIALALALKGCHLRLCARDEKALQSVQKEAFEFGAPSCLLFPMDLSASRHNIIELVQGPVDILINNAARAHALKPLEQIDHIELFKSTWLNVYAPVMLMQAVIPGMKARGSGTIINICSLAGRRGLKNLSIYSGTKFALRGITEAVAQELAGSGVTCFSVSPGGMQTKTREDLFGHDNMLQQQAPGWVSDVLVRLIESVGESGGPANGEDYVMRKHVVKMKTPEKW